MPNCKALTVSYPGDTPGGPLGAHPTPHRPSPKGQPCTCRRRLLHEDASESFARARRARAHHVYNRAPARQLVGLASGHLSRQPCSLLQFSGLRTQGDGKCDHDWTCIQPSRVAMHALAIVAWCARIPSDIDGQHDDSNAGRSRVSTGVWMSRRLRRCFRCDGLWHM